MPEKGDSRQPKPVVSDRSPSARVAGVADPLAGGRIEKAVQLAGAPIGQRRGVAAEVADLSRRDGHRTHRGLAVVRLLPRGIVDGGHRPQLNRCLRDVAHPALEGHAAVGLTVTSVIHQLRDAAPRGTEQARDPVPLPPHEESQRGQDDDPADGAALPALQGGNPACRSGHGGPTLRPPARAGFRSIDHADLSAGCKRFAIAALSVSVTGESTMTPKQIQIVQSTFTKVAPIAEIAADLFHARLFDLDPQLKAMFKGDMKRQGMLLMSMLSIEGVPSESRGARAYFASDGATPAVGGVAALRSRARCAAALHTRATGAFVRAARGARSANRDHHGGVAKHLRSR